MMKDKGKKTVPPITDGEVRIKAMKGGLEKYFSEMAWRIGNLEKMGWTKVGVISKAVEVEVEEIKVVEIPNDKYPPNDEIKAWLKEHNVNFHHALGTEKLRRLYDANTK